MTDHEQTRFEAQLRQLKPGKLPEELVERIQTAVSVVPAPRAASARQFPGVLQFLRWLIPTAAAAGIALVVWHYERDTAQSGFSKGDAQEGSVAAVPLQPDNVQIGKELVSSFDAVATLPSGEPVRFRCQQWINTVVVDDERRGLVMQSRMPRVVVVPVGFETY